MSNSSPIDPQVPSKDASGQEGSPIVPPFEERLRLYWEKNAKPIYTAIAVILLVVLAKGGWEYYQAQQEKGVQEAYAAATTPEKLKSFVSEHPGHPLAGIASLRLADDAYAAGHYVDAQMSYQRAADALKQGPFAARARLGLAVSKLVGGQKAEGEEKLKQLANDLAVLKSVRAEAAFHYATAVLDEGKTEEAAKYLDLASTVDQAGLWAQRAMMLRTTLPVASTPASAPAPAAPAPKP